MFGQQNCLIFSLVNLLELDVLQIGIILKFKARKKQMSLHF